MFIDYFILIIYKTPTVITFQISLFSDDIYFYLLIRQLMNAILISYFYL
jgi:hypothetical protein